jgi:hypothetical protein
MHVTDARAGSFLRDVCCIICVTRHPGAAAMQNMMHRPGAYCVFHEEPAVALARFFFAITRHFLMLGVFVGLFGGQRVGHFFFGGVILAK